MKFAALVVVVAASPAPALAGGSGDGFFQITEIYTTTDRHYSEVEILQVDPNGLIFRHSRGMAKVLFTDLNPSIRERFGYDPEAAAAFVKGRPSPRSKGGKGEAHPHPPALKARPIVIINASSQVINSRPPCPVYPPALSMYAWRRAAELDLLYASGLLPRPYGWGWPGRRIW